MIRTFKLMTVGALGAWLLASTGCEDKACQESLQTCKKESTEQQKECAANGSKINQLKAELADAQAKLDSLNKENAELKAKSDEAAPKGKSKPAKGKHKKRGKK